MFLLSHVYSLTRDTGQHIEVLLMVLVSLSLLYYFCYHALLALPATWGQAIEVPLIVLVAVSLVCQVLVMEDPGAKMSTHDP